MSITWVSCLYNIYNDNHYNPNLEKNVKSLLDIDLNLIIYTDSFFYKFLSNYIEEKGLKNITLILLELSELPIYKKLMNTNLNLPIRRNEQKDTKAYMALMNSKIDFIKKASLLSESKETPFMGWIDLGIGKIFRNGKDTFDRLKNFKIKDNVKTIIIPGPYKIGVNIDILCGQVFWLFCGGFFICNKSFISTFYDITIRVLDLFIQKGYIVWEVNLWAYIYNINRDLIICYPGDHNDSIINIPDIYLLKSGEEETIYKKREVISYKHYNKEFSDAYFLLKEIYDKYQKEHPILNEDMFVTCYYLGKLDEGRLALNRLLFSNIDHIAKTNAMKSAVFYTQKINSKENIKDITPFKNSDEKIFTPSSPSIFIKDGKAYFNIRAVNYTISNTGMYSIRHPQNYLITKNFLCMTNNWKSISSKKYNEIFSSLDCMNPRFPMHIKGLEDMRIFNVENNKIHLFATCCECKSFFVPRIVYACYDIKEGEEVFVKELNIPDIPIRCEKNWGPFMDGDEIKFIYSLNPLRVYKVNKDFSVTLIKYKEQKNFFDMRGSAAPIPYNNGWLFTIHQIEDSLPRKYYHRLVWYDKNFENNKFSDLFYFDKIGIEFNLGIAISKGDLLFSYSVHDGSSNLLSVSLQEIDKMLQFSNSVV